MSRILVVQPSKMLQQAFAFALAAEHQIQVTEKIPESQAAPEADLAIVDADALRDGDAAAMRRLNAIRSWRIPIVWIGAETPPAEPAASKFVQLTPPLDRESLKKALADCLGSPTSAPSRQSPSTPKSPAASASKETKPKGPQRNAVAADDKEVIELVEVVDEQPARDLLKAGVRKKS
ncbi:MAG: hypothetical protein ACREQ2_05635 [Candidatus Binatia bacterium]